MIRTHRPDDEHALGIGSGRDGVGAAVRLPGDEDLVSAVVEPEADDLQQVLGHGLAGELRRGGEPEALERLDVVRSVRRDRGKRPGEDKTETEDGFHGDTEGWGETGRRGLAGPNTLPVDGQNVDHDRGTPACHRNRIPGSLRPVKQCIVTLDMEGVLTPEIWIAVADKTGLAELRRTTRDEPDYDKLMTYRLGILDRHGITLSRIQEVIGQLAPLPGALGFLRELRELAPVVILSDTFEQFAAPLLRQLDWPTLWCHRLEVRDDRITGYRLRPPTRSVRRSGPSNRWNTG